MVTILKVLECFLEKKFYGKNLQSFFVVSPHWERQSFFQYESKVILVKRWGEGRYLFKSKSPEWYNDF